MKVSREGVGANTTGVVIDTVPYQARVVNILSRDTEAVRVGSCMADATSLAATAVDSRLVVTRRSGIGDFCYARIRERSSTSARFQQETRARGPNGKRKGNQATLRQ